MKTASPKPTSRGTSLGSMNLSTSFYPADNPAIKSWERDVGARKPRALEFLCKYLNFTIIVALTVITLGAYTRLTNAGLGCPDWPFCYGQVIVPQASYAMAKAAAFKSAQVFEAAKALTEMVHRYMAGVLVLLVVFSTFFVKKIRKQGVDLNLFFPFFLISIIIFQALFGMWTVTWKLLPLVVCAHLLLGAILFCSLVLFRFSLRKNIIPPLPKAWRLAIFIGALLVFLQMLLGGFVSANYAGIACTKFPTCNGSFWPISMETLKALKQLFVYPIGVNYQGGVFPQELRVAIQVVHRLGALCVAFYSIGFASILGFKSLVKDIFWQRMLGTMLFLLGVQVILGIINVVYFLPLFSAVLHNIVAVLLFTTWMLMLSIKEPTK